MKVQFVERINNSPAPPHDIYRDPCSGLFGECFETDEGLKFSDLPLCECLSALRNIVADYDKWLMDFRAVGRDGLTYTGLSNHNAAVYWRTYRLYNKSV